MTASEADHRLGLLERAIQNAQSQISDVLHKYRADNSAIKHLAIYSVSGTLLAYTPDEEVSNNKLQMWQYEWLGRTIRPSIISMYQVTEQFKSQEKKRVARDFGRPRVLRIQTDGEAVSQIYTAPIDDMSLIFAVLTSRATSKRNVFVVNESLLLGDLDALILEIVKVIASVTPSS